MMEKQTALKAENLILSNDYFNNIYDENAVQSVYSGITASQAAY